MTVEKVKGYLRDLIRNVIVYDFVRSVIRVVLRHLWPQYPELVLFALALSSGWLDAPETRSWPRVVVAAIVTEVLLALWRR